MLIDKRVTINMALPKKNLVSTMDYFKISICFLSLLVGTKADFYANQINADGVFTGPGYYWRDFNGHIPDDAFPTGNPNYFIGQLVKSRTLVPVLVHKDGQEVFAEFSYAGQPYTQKNNFQILCTTDASQFEWHKTNANDLHNLMFHRHFIIGGYDDGLPTFIGRAMGSRKIGKISAYPKWSACVYVAELKPSGAGPHGVGHYWRDYEGHIPSDALEVAPNMYIGQVFANGVLKPAHINGLKHQVEYLHNGRIYTTNHQVKILCSTDPSQFEWVKTDISNIMRLLPTRHFVPGGYSENDKPYLIGRSHDHHIVVSCDQRTPGYFWRDFYDRIPDDAFPAGKDRYIGQVLSEKNHVLVPAQVSTNPLYATYTYEAKFYSTDSDFKILGTTDTNQFEWVTTNNDDMKQLVAQRELIPGGFDDNYPLFIGKSLKGGFIGKVTINPIWAGLVYPDENNVHHHDYEFQVSIEEKKYEKKSTSPERAVLTGAYCDVYYLPKNVKPIRYAITIEPNFTDVGWKPSVFWGNVTIQLQALVATKNITLHAVELDIDSSEIKIIGNGEIVPVENTITSTEDQIFVINLKKELVPQQVYNLTIGKYTGGFDFNSRGLYKASYGPSYKNQKIVAVTHFEPTLARYAFPCFDEPQLKAKFIVNLIRSKSYNSVSNEELDKTEKLDENRYKDVFKETPPMPTYTLAFAMSDFNSTERKERHRIYAQHKAFEKNELELPLNLSIKTLNVLEEYLGVNYTFSKMDSFAVPRGYFKHFAMENWGLIIYGEEHIRCSNKTGIFTLKQITSYIAHEFAHQWFGNLVTHASWDYIWLSESFAAYFQYFIASKVEPSWRLMDQFVEEIVQESFHDEQISGSHGLTFRISRYGQFPPFHIMYQKGSSIVWMMSHFLTEDIFRKSLHSYLLDRQYQAVVPDDLYRFVQKTVDDAGANHLLGNMTVSEILNPWVTLEGYPIINVTRNYVTGEVVLTQYPELTTKNHTWIIPINYVISNNKLNFEDTKADFWMIDKTMKINLDKEGWLVVNKQHSGYYRVNYDLENWERIIQVLKSNNYTNIHVLSRVQLINDAFYLAYANKLPVDVPFRLAEYLVREKDYIAFASFYSSLSTYCRMYQGGRKQSEVDYFLNHPLRNSIMPSNIGYSEDYLVFQVIPPILHARINSFFYYQPYSIVYKMHTFHFVFAVIGYGLVNGDRYRLPKDVVPLRYHLTMEPVLSGSNSPQHLFYGSVVIELLVLNYTSTITFHADKIQITSSSISLTDRNKRLIAIKKSFSDDETNTFTLHLQKSLQQGAQYNLTIQKFNGILRSGDGFFLGEYYADGSNRFMAGTHFQPKAARKAFPCFDEPSFKAKFIVNLIRTAEYYSLSNQELQRTEILPNKRFKDIYKDTPVMSTYILSFAVLNFRATKRFERHRVYALSDVITAVDAPLKAAVCILQWFENYTGVDYPLNKMDHLAVPDNFIVDKAMENWGLIVYQEKNLKYTDDLYARKRVLTYVAHELAHQWFGNLVTPETFDYLWLSEAISTYFQYYAASFIEPTWRLMDLFLIDNVHNGFFKEEKEGAYPLNYNLPDSKKFPPFHILYEKGSSILRMMTHFLSQEVFQQSLNRYLNQNKYKNVIPSDLYTACQEIIDRAATGTGTNLENMSVEKIMSTWDSNSGYPIVTVNRNYQSGVVSLKQSSAIDNQTNTFWNIPINYVHSKNPNFFRTDPRLWLTTESKVIKGLPTDGWLIVNTQQTGYYRVNYDLENWKRIINFLHNEDIDKIHVLNRAQLINDAFYFAYEEIIPVSIPLTLCEYLVRETDYIPFASFYNSLSNYVYIYVGLTSPEETEFLHNHTLAANVPPSTPDDYSREYKIFQKYIRYIMANIRNSLGPVDRPEDTYIENIYLIFAIIAYRSVNGDRYQLPRDVVPLRYDLTMEPILSGTSHKKNPFYGSVIIELSVLNSTSVVTLHAENILIKRSAITIRDNKKRLNKITKTSNNDKTSTYTFHLKNMLKKGSQYILKIRKFRGYLGFRKGFFMEKYQDNQTDRFMAGTDFQLKNARRAFPCFDEPSFKAKFIVNLIRTSKYYSLSNQVLRLTKKLKNKRFKDIYKETPKMSTYMLSFAVLKLPVFKKLERHRVYALSDVNGIVDGILKAAVYMLQWFEKYTNVEYPLSKIDHVVVPYTSINYTAIGSWGLIVYQDVHLKYTDDLYTKKRVLLYIAHQLAHQWFGNLVTPKNFDYFWLSEAMSTYLKYYAASFIEPSWRLLDQFLIDNVHNGFFKEEQKGTYSLNYHLPETENFPPSYILYEKGSSILRMMTNFLSPKIFQKCLFRYLNQNRYKNVIPKDLYSACQKVFDNAKIGTNLENMTVAKIMSTWDSNSGYPIVTATRNYYKRLVTLKQDAAINNQSNSLWTIPINYVHSNNPSFTKTVPQLWLTTKSKTVNNFPSEGWLILNIQQTGYYRVNYDLENWRRIIYFLKNGNIDKIHILNRAQLINDAFYLAYNEVLPVSIPLTLSEYLVRETDYIPFASFYNSIIKYLHIYFRRPSQRKTIFFSNLLATYVLPTRPKDHELREDEIFQNYIRYVMTNIRDSLGPVDRPQDTYTQILLRNEIVAKFERFFNNE
ncbi:hypothetical protein RN001_014011 [Aquatica leii]|uniref:Aminopeptidase N n=1 Tax=Aquatica leii TaxID=1421715 RepID=A0AAN7S7B3_9COLE|nr:hypothetical protein RN001_014011 [Aquatica leii]